nr:DUF4424 family protein [uncultured Cohaesibacter sp.]
MLQSVSDRYFIPTLLFTIILFACAFSVEPAKANDGSAMLEAGGIRLVENQVISLDVEDLYISPKEIRIHYEFVNPSDQDVKLLVAFPVPLIDAEPEMNYGNQNVDPVNFLDFTVIANGKRISPEMEVKLVMNGQDYTKLLIDNGVPLHRFSPDYYERLDKISAASRQILAQNGLIEWTPGEEWFTKKWKVKVNYYWWQTFPANSRTVLDHSYAPVVGGGIVDEEYGIRDNIGRFCIDDGFIRGFRNLLKQSGHNSTISSEVRYILMTANTWLGPIGDFRLVIDKLKPKDLISLCINGIHKIAPTRFEFRAKNFVPDRDLDILFIKQPDW